MNAVGIDVSKGKSMVAILRPFGEVVRTPFEVAHDADGLDGLITLLKGLDGETKALMEYTGHYYAPVANRLHGAGIFVSVVHPLLIHKYSNNSIRQGKTDKKDSLKLASYALERWISLPNFSPEDETRMMLKVCCRQYNQYLDLRISLKNNLMALLDQTYPNIYKHFVSPPRTDEHEKWVDFVSRFWHCDCVCSITEKRFIVQYNTWCKKVGYYPNDRKAQDLYKASCGLTATLPQNDNTKFIVNNAVTQINAVNETIAATLHEMQRLASCLPEYPVVMGFGGVGPVLGPQLIAEIGNVRRFERKQQLVAFAGIDAPPYQSGTFESHHRSISKRGSPFLRKALFITMAGLIQRRTEDGPVYQFMDRKRSEGKHYHVYCIAGANKFLRIYYARVKEYLESLELND